MPIPRRQFLKTAALGTAGLFLSSRMFAQEEQSSSPVKVGIIGCGGRGMGAATDALDADPGAVIWAMADVFEEQMTKGVDLLNTQYPESRISCPPERRFSGLDGYKRLLQSGVDLVLHCAPPVFRPMHIKATVEAGKHLFAEKPVAVDVPGVLSVLESAKLAKEKNLIAYDGFCWRYDPACREALAELKKGTFGAPLSFNGIYYLTPPKTSMTEAARPSGMSDLDWSLQNWMALNWLSGGPLVEQNVHTIDLMCWCFDEALPIAAFGSGGRAQRDDMGDVWDHYQVIYELPDRKQATISTRQWKNCHVDISNRTICEKGTLVTPYRPRFEGQTRWRYSGEASNMYKQTHKELFADIRSGTPRQTLEQAANKTLITIMGRTAAHTGQRITWEEILKDTTSLTPAELSESTQLPPLSIPVPGKKI